MVSWWTRIVRDVEVKRQVVAFAVVAAVVAVAEALMFYRWLGPAQQQTLQRALAEQRMVPQSHPDPVLGAYLEVLDHRERELLGRCNRATVLHAVLIAVVPCVLVGGLYATSGGLRAASQRSMLLDIVLVAVASLAFMAYFAFFTQRWRYPDQSRMTHDIASDYLAAAAAEEAAR